MISSYELASLLKSAMLHFHHSFFQYYNIMFKSILRPQELDLFTRDETE